MKPNQNKNNNANANKDDLLCYKGYKNKKIKNGAKMSTTNERKATSISFEYTPFIYIQQL